MNLSLFLIVLLLVAVGAGGFWAHRRQIRRLKSYFHSSLLNLQEGKPIPEEPLLKEIQPTLLQLFQRSQELAQNLQNLERNNAHLQANLLFLRTLLELMNWQGSRAELQETLVHLLLDVLQVEQVLFFDYVPTIKGFHFSCQAGKPGVVEPSLQLSPDEHPFFLRRIFTSRASIALQPDDPEAGFLLSAVKTNRGFLSLLRREGSLYGLLLITTSTEDSATLQKIQEMFDGYAKIITLLLENHAVREESQRHIKDLELVHQINLQISSILEFSNILTTSVEQVARALESDVAMIELVENDEIHLRSSSGISLEEVKGMSRMKIGESLSGWVAAAGTPLAVENIELDPRFKFKGQAQALGLTSYCGVPLIITGKLIGVLSVLNRQPRIYSPREIDLLNTIAGSMGVFLEQATLYQQLQDKLLELESVHQQLKAHDKEILHLNRQLQALQQFQQELVHSLPRALLNPLTIIKGTASIFQTGLQQTEKEKEIFFNFLNTQVDAMVDYLSQLSDFLLIQSGQFALYPETQSLKAFLETLFVPYHALGQAKFNSFQTQIFAEGEQATFDPRRLRLIFRGVLGRAFSKSKTGDTIFLQARAGPLEKLPLSPSVKLSPGEYLWVTIQMISAEGVHRKPSEVFDTLTKETEPILGKPEAFARGFEDFLTRYFISAHGGTLWVEDGKIDEPKIHFTVSISPTPYITTAEKGVVPYTHPLGIHSILLFKKGWDIQPWLTLLQKHVPSILRAENSMEAQEILKKEEPDCLFVPAAITGDILHLQEEIVKGSGVSQTVPYVVAPRDPPTTPASTPHYLLVLHTLRDRFHPQPAHWEIVYIDTLEALRKATQTEMKYHSICLFDFPLLTEVYETLVNLQGQGCFLILSPREKLPLILDCLHRVLIAP